MIDVILLISGSSKRMGKEKALLPFSSSKNFICHLLEIYSGIPDSNIVVIVNPRNSETIKQVIEKLENQITFIINQEPEKGRFYSILKGIKQLKKGSGVFIQNIDNPFVSLELIRGMLENYQPDSYLVPQFDGKNGHPLLLGAKLVQELKDNVYSIKDLKSFLNCQQKQCFITNDSAILANINSPEDYEKWFLDKKN